MKKIDVVLSLICGISLAWVANDFFALHGWVFFVLVPILCVISLDLITKFFDKKVIGQGTRHILTGAFADVVDIKIFQLLYLFFPDGAELKAISFLGAVVIKYFGNKYWAFDKPEKDGVGKERLQFLGVTLVGLFINVVSFSIFVKIDAGFSAEMWREISVIFALLFTAIWNFLGYKLLVFKK
jgi:putative flippase GtrA